MFCLFVLALTGLVAAQYGVPTSDTAYAPAVSAYAPQPVILPELPAAHEILLPRRSHHRRNSHRHSSSRSRSNESHENKPRCAKCQNVKKKYPVGCIDCYPAEVKYFTQNGCKVAHIECEKSGRSANYVLTGETLREVTVLAAGDQSASKLVKCSGTEWKGFAMYPPARITVDNVFCGY